MNLNANLSANLNPKTSPYLPWIVCLSSGLFFFYEFIQMQMFNSISTDLMRDFSLNAKQLGYLSATYLLADVIFLFPAGLLLDRFSARTIILVALVIAVLSTFLFAISHSALVVGICHFLAGIGNAFCFLSSIRLASRWFPPQKMALIVGIIVTMAMFGGMVAQTPLALLNQSIGWRNSLLWISVMGVLITFIVFRYVRDYPAGYEKEHIAEQKQLQSEGVAKSIYLALANRQNWFCGIYTSFLNLPIMLLGAVWGNLYLTQVEKVSTIEASTIIMMIFVGMIVGCPLIGRISDQLGKRRSPMIVFGVLSLLVMLIITMFHPMGFWPLIFLFFALGFFTSAQIISYPMIAESNPRMLTSSATGLASVLIMGGGAVFQPVFGWVIDRYWDGTIVNGSRVYSVEAFNIAMWIMPAAFVIAIIMSLLVKETNCKTIDADSNELSKRL
jgi:sugar phosphate permease